MPYVSGYVSVFLFCKKLSPSAKACLFDKEQILPVSQLLLQVIFTLGYLEHIVDRGSSDSTRFLLFSVFVNTAKTI